jgi:hypothetical protein
VLHDQGLSVHVGLDDFDAARENHEHGEIAIAGLVHYLASARRAMSSVRLQPGDLRGGQLRKHLCLAAEEEGVVGCPVTVGHLNLQIANFAAGPCSNPGLNRIEGSFFLCFREVAY